MAEKQQYEVTVTKIRSTDYSDEVAWSHSFYTFATSEAKAKQNIIFREKLNQKLYSDYYYEEYFQFDIHLVNEIKEEKKEEETPKEADPHFQVITIFDDLDDDDDNRYAKPCK